MSKKNNLPTSIIILGVMILLVVVFGIIWTTKIHFNVDAKCRFENIDYVDLEENISCWNNDDTESYWEIIDGELKQIYSDEDTFLDEYCPMPQTVDYDFRLIMPLNVKSVVEFIKEID